MRGVPPAVAAELNELDPLRIEALCHALPPGAPQPQGEWQEPYSGRRWHVVQAEMKRLSELGLTTTREEQDALALNAATAMSDKTRQKVIEQWW